MEVPRGLYVTKEQGWGVTPDPKGNDNISTAPLDVARVSQI